MRQRNEYLTRIGDEIAVPGVTQFRRDPHQRHRVARIGERQRIGTGEPRAEVSVRTSSGDIRIHWLQQRIAAQPIPMPPPVSSVPRAPGVPTPPEPSSAPREDATADSSQGSSQDDQREAILDSLAKGEITVEEADLLLAYLDESRVES
jgi:hypothetical protein